MFQEKLNSEIMASYQKKKTPLEQKNVIGRTEGHSGSTIFKLPSFDGLDRI